MKPRIPPLQVPDEPTREILARTPHKGGRPLNVFGTLAHHPDLLKRFAAFGALFVRSRRLAARDSEITILRVGWRAQCKYVFGEHTLIGQQRAGLDFDEIRAIATPEPTSLRAEDLALIHAVDELFDTGNLTDQTWSELIQRWHPDQQLEFVTLVGFYRMTSDILKVVRIEPDQEVPGWPNE